MRADTTMTRPITEQRRRLKASIRRCRERLARRNTLLLFEQVPTTAISFGCSENGGWLCSRLEDTEWEGEACSICQIGISHEEVYYLPHIKASNTKHPARKSQACMPPSALVHHWLCVLYFCPLFSASFSCPSSISEWVLRDSRIFEDARVNSTWRTPWLELCDINAWEVKKVTKIGRLKMRWKLKGSECMAGKNINEIVKATTKRALVQVHMRQSQQMQLRGN